MSRCQDCNLFVSPCADEDPEVEDQLEIDGFDENLTIRGAIRVADTCPHCGGEIAEGVIDLMGGLTHAGMEALSKVGITCADQGVGMYEFETDETLLSRSTEVRRGKTFYIIQASGNVLVTRGVKIVATCPWSWEEELARADMEGLGA